MSVQSARIQQVVAGDDFTFRHTILAPVVKGGSETLDLVQVASGDVVHAIYDVAPADPAVAPVSLVGVPVGSYPTSQFDFTGVQADSAKLKPGYGQTVRIEITRVSGKLESHYLYNEYDVIGRGFPTLSGVELP